MVVTACGQFVVWVGECHAALLKANSTKDLLDHRLLMRRDKGLLVYGSSQVVLTLALLLKKRDMP